MEAKPRGILYLQPFLCSTLNTNADEVSWNSSSAYSLFAAMQELCPANEENGLKFFRFYSTKQSVEFPM